jgi:lipoprotein-releasing system permease protein
LSSKKKKNVINIITRISVVGITVITASLVILLSAFNGIEKMIEKLYSDFDATITIRSSERKTFFDSELNWNLIKNQPEIQLFAKAIEETVVLKNEDKWANAQLIGVDSVFLAMSKMPQHMVDGYPILYEEGDFTGIIGASLLDKLGGYIPQEYGREFITVYGPKRDLKMSAGKNPFITKNLTLAGRMNFNREVNYESLVVPIDFARTVLAYGEDEISAIYIDLKDKSNKHKVKEDLQSKLGTAFKVKTNDEKNELIFQTSKTERLIVIVIMVFIFILASFNLVSSLTMLFVEKKDDVSILKSMGADGKFIFRIFFYEGLLIAFKGIFFGLLIGYGISFTQYYFGLLEMPNSYGELFPIAMKLSDGLLIIGLVSSLSFLASYFPVKILLKRNGII